MALSAMRPTDGEHNRSATRWIEAQRGVFMHKVGQRSTVCCVTAPIFDPDELNPDYVYRRMATHLEARIAAGELKPGTRLPGERDLADEYGVSLSTARRAVKELRDRGRVVTLPAKGTYVAPSS